MLYSCTVTLWLAWRQQCAISRLESARRFTTRCCHVRTCKGCGSASGGGGEGGTHPSRQCVLPSPAPRLAHKSHAETWAHSCITRHTAEKYMTAWPGGGGSSGGKAAAVTAGPINSGAPPSPPQARSERPGRAANPRESAKRDHHHVGQVAAARKSSPPWAKSHQNELLEQI